MIKDAIKDPKELVKDPKELVKDPKELVKDPRDARDPARDPRDSTRDLRELARDTGRESKEPREPRDSKEPREARDPKEPRETRDPKEPREARDPKEPREAKEPRDAREPRDAKELRERTEGREARDSKEMREPRDARDSKEPKDPREARDAKEHRERAEVREPREPRDARESREPRDSKADVGAVLEEPSDAPFPDAIRPSIPPLPAAGPWRSYKEMVAQIATRIVEAQRPVRVLQSIRWGDEIEEEFRRSRYRELPKMSPEDYKSVELGFDPQAKIEELEAIARDIDGALGHHDAIGDILERTAIEYRDVVRMLAARGTPTFYGYSRKLYGSPKDKFPDGKNSLRDLGHAMYQVLTKIDESHLGNVEQRTLTANECARTLNERFTDYFADATVRVEVDDGIIADAAAGSDYVKVRTGAKFSARDIDILEVHEGWVHVATSLNGQQQSVAKWLAKGPPRTTAVQEGLAALLEIFTFRTYPRRARRLNDRVLAVDKAEDGASFLEVFEWFRTEGYPEEECYHNTRRIFRGGVLEGGAPFTKDSCYCKGVVLNYAFIRSAIQHNHVDLIPFLFVGKVAHEDVPVLARRVADGVVKPPRYLPPMFRDLNGLAIWMAYSWFFSQLGGEAISDHYARLFART